MSDFCSGGLISNFPTLDPYDPNDILNDNYISDKTIKSGFAIEIYLGEDIYDFTWWYNPPTMEIEDNRGFERGYAKFDITDYLPVGTNLPFVPVANQKIMIWNRNKTDLFFSGRITSVEGKLITRKCDGTEATVYSIVASDTTVVLERILVVESYQNVTTSFIVADVLRRFMPIYIDVSGIDTTQGQVLSDFKVQDQYVSQVIQRILDIEPTWTFWIDKSTNIAYLGEVGETYNTIGNIVESNVYDVFDAPSFKLTQDTSIIRNRVKFFYNSVYKSGTVSVTTGSNIVLGQGTFFTRFISEGSDIRVNGSDATYRIDRVVSDIEIRISNAYQEVIETEVPFEITGNNAVIIIEDSASVAREAAINNEDNQYAGITDYLVPNDNAYYTRDEAYQIAKSHLLRFTQPLMRGSATTNNTKFPVRTLRAGQVINFDLPISRKISADVVIQKIVWKDTGAILCRSETDPLDDRIDPYLIINLDFQDRVFDQRNQVKRIMSDVRKSRGTNDGTTIEDAKIFSENIFIDDCFNLVPPIGGTSTLNISDNAGFLEPVIFQDELNISDTINLITPPSAPYYTTPTSRQAGYCIGVFNFGFTS